MQSVKCALTEERKKAIKSVLKCSPVSADREKSMLHYTAAHPLSLRTHETSFVSAVKTITLIIDFLIETKFLNYNFDLLISRFTDISSK